MSEEFLCPDGSYITPTGDPSVPFACVVAAKNDKLSPKDNPKSVQRKCALPCHNLKDGWIAKGATGAGHCICVPPKKQTEALQTKAFNMDYFNKTFNECYPDFDLQQNQNAYNFKSHITQDNYKKCLTNDASMLTSGGIKKNYPELGKVYSNEDFAEKEWKIIKTNRGEIL